MGTGCGTSSRQTVYDHFMKAAVLVEVGAPPRFGDFAEPEPSKGQIVVEVAAAGVHHLDLAKASGSFYLGPPTVPCVVGSDGVGRTADGRRVFFDAPVAPYGSWAQRALISAAALMEVADEVDDVTAAALGNTGLAAWLALSWRARLQPGQSVLVLGATGAVGSVAVQAAKAQGASYVVAADRNPDRLHRAQQHGADATVVLAGGTDIVSALRETAGPHGIDVIIDPLWASLRWRPCTRPHPGPGMSRSAIPRQPQSPFRRRRCARLRCKSWDSPCFTLQLRCGGRPTRA